MYKIYVYKGENNEYKNLYFHEVLIDGNNVIKNKIQYIIHYTSTKQKVISIKK